MPIAPTGSNFGRCAPRVSGSQRAASTTASTPIGTFTRKIGRQVQSEQVRLQQHAAEHLPGHRAGADRGAEPGHRARPLVDRVDHVDQGQQLRHHRRRGGALDQARAISIAEEVAMPQARLASVNAAMPETNIRL